MTKVESTIIDEDEEGCESSRGKEGKFVIERSESGMDSKKSDAKSSGGGGGGSSSSGSNAISAGDSNSKPSSDSNRDRGNRERQRIPNNLCRDFIFHSCNRRGCKYDHPDPDSQEYKDARASRPDFVPRGSRRERTRSPPGASSHETGDGKPVCRDYLRNMCFRGKDCRFYHPSDVEREELPWPQLCIDYRAGNCKRFECRFLHYGTEDEEYFMRHGVVRKELWDNFLSVVRRDPHVLKSRPVCKLFLANGECSMDVCRFRHVSQREYEDDLHQTLMQMVYEKCRKINPDIPPNPRSSMPPRDDDLPLPHRGGPSLPLPGPPGFGRDYDGDMRGRMGGSDSSYDYQSRNPYGPYPKQPDPTITMDLDQLNRENIDLRRIINEDSSRYKLDVDRLTMENSKLQDQLNYMKSGGGGVSSQTQQQLNMLQQENAEFSAKIKTMNDWNVELQAKFSTARREVDELRDSVKVLNLELATVSEEKIKLKRKSDELEAKLQVMQSTRDEASIAIEKKEYLETKLKQYYEGMKRCETEFVNILEKNFNILTPNIMSYFPSWGYLMSFVTEIVTQINSSASNASSSQSYLGSSSGSGFGSYGGASNYSVPPPGLPATSSSLSSNYNYASDYSGTPSNVGGSQPSSQTNQQATSGNYNNYYSGYSYGSGDNGTMYGGGSDPYNSSSYGNAATPAPASASSAGALTSRSSKDGKKDLLAKNPPWSKRT